MYLMDSKEFTFDEIVSRSVFPGQGSPSCSMYQAPPPPHPSPQLLSVILLLVQELLPVARGGGGHLLIMD